MLIAALAGLERFPIDQRPGNSRLRAYQDKEFGRQNYFSRIFGRATATQGITDRAV